MSKKKHKKCLYCGSKVSTYASQVTGKCGTCVSKKKDYMRHKPVSKVKEGIVQILHSDDYLYYTAEELVLRLRWRDISTSAKYVKEVIRDRLNTLLVKTEMGSSSVYVLIQ